MAAALDTFPPLSWRDGKKPVQSMRRAVNSVVTNNCVIFRPWGFDCIHVYDFEHDSWYQLPDCPFVYSSLVYVQHRLTTVGGEWRGACTDKLLCLTWDGDPKWEDNILPPMLTKRKNPISVTTGDKWLVVSGGIQAGQYLTIVELLDIEIKQWASVASLPEPIFNASITFGQGYIYMLGGNRAPGQPTTSVLSCQVDELIDSDSADKGVWRNLADLPVERSSCVSLHGNLLAIGGQYHSLHAPCTLHSSRSPVRLSSSVYRYNQAEDTWSVVGDLGVAVSECFAAVLPGNKLMVLGGNTRQGVTDRVLLGNIDTY